MPWLFLLLVLGAVLIALVLWYFLDRHALPRALALGDAPGEGRRAGEFGRAAIEALQAAQLELAEEPAPLVAAPSPIEPLPSGYGVDEAVALVKDPHQLYVYWELGGPGEAALAARIGPRFPATRRALRIHDLDEGALYQWWVGEEHDHWWVHAFPGHRYVAEIGRAGPEGTWYPLARSLEVATPGTQPAASRHDPVVHLQIPGATGVLARAGWSPGAVPGSPWGMWGARS